MTFMYVSDFRFFRLREIGAIRSGVKKEMANFPKANGARWGSMWLNATTIPAKSQVFCPSNNNF
jgi:hypothetical protein